MTTIYYYDELQAQIIERDKIIENQRKAIQFLLDAIYIAVNAPSDNGEHLQDAYRLVSSQSTMTGTGEK